MLFWLLTSVKIALDPSTFNLYARLSIERFPLWWDY